MRSDVPEDRMEHIDEGTIHAWLDGALPADEGGRIEEHVTSCAACAAAVAEARGLIAASSRILAALDDVPGGVIPVAVVAGESVTPALPQSNDDAPRTSSTPAGSVVATSASAERAASHDARSAGRASRRPWYRRPQWAAAAGISFLAVAATAVWQRSGAPSVMDGVNERASAAAPMVAAEQANDAVQDSAAPAAAGGANTNAPAPSATTLARAKASRGDAATSTERKSLAGAAPGDFRKEVVGKARRVVPESVPAPAAANASERDVARRAAVPAAPPPAVASISDEARARQSPDSLAARRVGAITADAITRSESARVAGDVSAQRKSANAIAEVTTTSASPSAAARAPTPLHASGSAAAPATPASLAGCYRVLPADVAEQAGIRGLLQLDFAGAGSDESRPAYAAREVGGTNIQPALAREVLRWTLSIGGDVVVVRGEGAAARRVTMRIGVPLDSLAAQQLQGTRVPCPGR